MLKFAGHMVGFDQGDVVLFSDFEDDGEMWTGQGPRLTRQRVAFSEGFHQTPAVSVSMSMFDFSNGANTRADVQAENTSRSGFDIVFRTWGDTQVARVRVAWTALGLIGDDEAWDI